MLQISRIETLSLDGIELLLSESLAEGHQFVARLRDDWIAGANRFDKPGEVLLAACDGGRLVGVCGLNVDPFINVQGVGRLRHLFVAPGARRAGVGRELTSRICETGTLAFERIRLRVGNPEASVFYANLGFEPIFGDAYCTHQKWLSSHYTKGPVQVGPGSSG